MQIVPTRSRFSTELHALIAQLHALTPPCRADSCRSHNGYPDRSCVRLRGILGYYRSVRAPIDTAPPLDASGGPDPVNRLIRTVKSLPASNSPPQEVTSRGNPGLCNWREKTRLDSAYFMFSLFTIYRIAVTCFVSGRRYSNEMTDLPKLPPVSKSTNASP